MSHHELDNPAWHALTGPHAALALGAPPVLRYPPDVSPFMAFEGGRMPDDLAAAVPPGETGAALAGAALEAPPGFEVAMVLEVLQMVADDVAAVEGDAAIETLSPADADEMLALTDLTKPGPFARRTIAMGEGIAPSHTLMAAAYLHDLVTMPKNHPDRSRASAMSATAAGPIMEALGFAAGDVAGRLGLGGGRVGLLRHGWSQGLV